MCVLLHSDAKYHEKDKSNAKKFFLTQIPSVKFQICLMQISDETQDVRAVHLIMQMSNRKINLLLMSRWSHAVLLKIISLNFWVLTVKMKNHKKYKSEARCGVNLNLSWCCCVFTQTHTWKMFKDARGIKKVRGKEFLTFWFAIELREAEKGMEREKD